MNKSQEEIDDDKFYKKKEKYFKERKEFLKYQREYRLKHPLYNWVFSYEPKYFGIVSGFVSAFFWVGILGLGPIPHLMAVATGIFFWFIQRISLNEFEEKTKSNGLSFNGHYHLEDKDIRL